jgi:hypothetical protein
MSHFAKIDDDNIVTQVVVAEQDYIDSIQELTLVSEEVRSEDHSEIITPSIYKSDKWIQTSYNTSGGVHYCAEVKYVSREVEARDEYVDSEGNTIPAVEAAEAVYVEGNSPEDIGKPNGEVALRKNFAGIGYTYDESRDAFYTPQPEPSASIPYVLNEDSCLWELSGSGS